jgi:hypothetical protein
MGRKNRNKNRHGGGDKEFSSLEIEKELNHEGKAW